MNDHRAKLDALMIAFLGEEISFEKFQQAYSTCYIDDYADANFSYQEVDHYGAVHEKAEWTTQKPTTEERRYGWINPAEFREWLSVHETHKPQD